MEDLKTVIEVIQNIHRQVSINWLSSINENIKFNYKKKTVADAYNNYELYNSIREYIGFLENINMELYSAISSIEINSVLECRIKKEKSVEFKLDNYHNSGLEGRVPIAKTLNDLFGVRIILNQTYSYQEIKEYIKNNTKKLKCLDSSKGYYIATHIYFNDSNFSFQWELQVWSNELERNNKKSHEQYKQDYTVWVENT